MIVARKWQIHGGELAIAVQSCFAVFPQKKSLEKEGEKTMNEAIEFGYWLVNSPKKEKFSMRWIQIKFLEFKRWREEEDIKNGLEQAKKEAEQK